MFGIGKNRKKVLTDSSLSGELTNGSDMTLFTYKQIVKFQLSRSSGGLNLTPGRAITQARPAHGKVLHATSGNAATTEGRDNETVSQLKQRTQELLDAIAPRNNAVHQFAKIAVAQNDAPLSRFS